MCAMKMSVMKVLRALDLVGGRGGWLGKQTGGIWQKLTV